MEERERERREVMKQIAEGKVLAELEEEEPDMESERIESKEEASQFLPPII